MNTTIKVARLAIFLTLSSLTIIATVSVAQVDGIATTTSKIVEARAYTESYVMIAKQSLAKQPPDLAQAQKLYAVAYSKYVGWASYVRTALHDGKSRRLTEDSDYKTKASDAASAGNAFINFVDSKTGGTKAVSALLSSLSALGLQLWNGIKDRQQKDRDAAAADFAQQTQWLPWEAINGQRQTSISKPDETDSPQKPNSAKEPNPQKPDQPKQNKPYSP